MAQGTKEYETLPEIKTEHFPGDGTPVSVRIRRVGRTELVDYRGMKSHPQWGEKPFQIVRAQLVIGGAWADHDWFVTPACDTSLLALEQKMGERLTVGSIVEVSRIAKENSTQWKLAAKKANGEEVAFDSFDDDTTGMAAPSLNSPPPPPPSTAPAPPAPSAELPTAPPSVGTAIVEHYTERAYLSNERLRAKHGENFPDLTAEALNAQAATAIIADQRGGVDQAALVLLPGYPIGLTGTEQEARGPEEVAEETTGTEKVAAVTADDIPF